MDDSFAIIRRSIRRHDVRWYVACRLRSLRARSLRAFEVLGHADFQTAGYLTASMADHLGIWQPAPAVGEG